MMASLASKKRGSDNRLISYKDLKTAIDDKLHLIAAELQKVKASMGLSGENHKKLVQQLRPIEEAITQIIEQPITAP